MLKHISPGAPLHFPSMECLLSAPRVRVPRIKGIVLNESIDLSHVRNDVSLRDVV